jgi:hypothetical protein
MSTALLENSWTHIYDAFRVPIVKLPRSLHFAFYFSRREIRKCSAAEGVMIVYEITTWLAVWDILSFTPTRWRCTVLMISRILSSWSCSRQQTDSCSL